MKKLLTLLLAGMFVFSAAACADAATAVKQKAAKMTYTKSFVQLPNLFASSLNSAASLSIPSGWQSTGITLDINYTSTMTNIVPLTYSLVDGELTASASANVHTERQDTILIEEIPDSGGDGGGDPITLDIHNTGKITTARNEWLQHVPAFYSEYASTFDFTGDGIADECEWLSDEPDALLCMPQAGKVNGVTELFGNLGGYANGFDKLSVLCDDDGNGIVEGNELDGIMLWIDSNKNGISDPGELHTLAEYGVAKLYTEQNNFVGKYETTNGETRTMWAWFPSVKR